MDREVVPYLETNLLDILEQEREALRKGDIRAVLALADRKLEAVKSPPHPTEIVRLRQLAVENRDLLAHLLDCWRSALITAVTPDGTLYGPTGEAPVEPQPLQRRYG